MTPEEQIAQLEQQLSALRTHALRTELTSALTAAKCRAEGMPDALAVLLASARGAFSTEGVLTSISIGEQAYDSAQEAASAFMRERSYLIEAETMRAAPTRVADRTTGAPGAPSEARPVAERGRTERRISLDALTDSGQSAGELAAEGWAEPPK